MATARRKVRVRRYNARMVMPLSCLAAKGNVVTSAGVLDEVDTGSRGATFGIVRLAIPNTQVDCSQYGQSVFADAVDAIQSVDLAFDALINEVDAGKMHIFLSDVMLDQEKGTKGRRAPIPFGKGDRTVSRKVMSAEGTITEFVPALHTDAQSPPCGWRCRCWTNRAGRGSTTSTSTTLGTLRPRPRCRVTTALS